MRAELQQFSMKNFSCLVSVFLPSLCCPFPAITSSFGVCVRQSCAVGCARKKSALESAADFTQTDCFMLFGFVARLSFFFWFPLVVALIPRDRTVNFRDASLLFVAAADRLALLRVAACLLLVCDPKFCNIQTQNKQNKQTNKKELCSLSLS